MSKLKEKEVGDKPVEVYKKTIKYKCPIRGWVEQEVEVKKFAPRETPESELNLAAKILGEEDSEDSSQEEKHERYSDNINYDD